VEGLVGSAWASPEEHDRFEMNASIESNRVLVIGLDGGTFDLIKPWAQAGELPTLARLMDVGSCGNLRSTIPALSPPAWTSFMTGQNPGKHGVFDFVRRRPGSYHLQSVRHDPRRSRTIFRLLSQAGKRVAVVNVPLTYPPEPVNGLMISGLGAPNKGRYVYPPELRTELEARGYRVNNTRHYAPGEEDAFLDDLMETTAIRARTAVELLGREKWDAFMVVFRNVDEIASFFWHHMDTSHPLHDPALAPRYGQAILDYHRRLDTLLAQIIEAAGEDVTVIVMSDHGVGPLHRSVYLNNWLREIGMLKLIDEGGIAWAHKTLLRRLGLTKRNLTQRIGWANVEKLKRFLPWQLLNLVPDSFPSLADSVDWPRTKAYSFGYIGQIYVNLRGREPQGVVGPGVEYEKVIEYLIDELAKFQDPDTGEYIVDAVYRKEELYHGRFLAEAPDLNVIMKNMSYITHIGREFAHHATVGPPSTYETATHRLEGILIASGPSIRAGVELSGARIIDVAPTIMYLLGLPVPSDMDGRVLVQMVEEARLRAQPVQRCAEDSCGHILAASPDEWTEEDERELIDRLRGLGYLE